MPHTLTSLLSFDTIVVGAGALGSAVLYHLARCGARVLALDRYAPPHDRGSSHGRTRIYRQAYYEAPGYVPLAQRALELWLALERDTRTTLFANTGALTIGPERGELFSGALRSARAHGLAHDVLTASDAARRFPAFVAPPDTVVLFEPAGGVLFPEACVSAHLALALKHGAAFRSGEEVLRVDARGGAGVVVTTRTARYEASRAVVAAGAWTPRLIGAEAAFTVTRETVHWFAPASARAAAASCPVAMIDPRSGPILYTIPDFGHGFKAGLHHAGRVTDPMSEREPVTADDAAPVADLVGRFAPGGAGALRSSAPCFYTTTRDHHFAIGELPATPAIILASACSGHGFKFASALGESIAKLALGQDAALPGALFGVARL